MAISNWTPQTEATGRKTVDERTLAARDREMLRAGLMVTVRSMMVSVLLGGAVLLGAMYLLKHSFAAGDQLLRGKAEDWYEAQMPAVLLALLGAAIGVFAGWRVTSSGGVAGWAGWVVGLLGVAVLCLMGVIGAVGFYPSPTPITVWIGLGALAVTTMLGLTFYTLWAS